MADFEMEMPESFDTGGQYLSEPGTYHFSVQNVDEEPKSKDGSLLQGFKIDAEVLAGPHAGKQIDLMFFNPKLTEKNGGEMSKKKQGRFALATMIVPTAKPGEKIKVDLQHAKSRQFIATVSLDDRETTSGKKFLQLNFADIWHVDDPSAPKCERNAAALNLLPKSVRRDPNSFKPAGSASGKSSGSNGNGNGHAGGNGNGNGGSGAGQQTAAAVDLDDL